MKETKWRQEGQKSAKSRTRAAVVKEFIDRLKGENLSLHAVLGVEKTACAPALMDNISLQRDKKKAAKEEEVAVRLLAAERASRKIARR